MRAASRVSVAAWSEASAAVCGPWAFSIIRAMPILPDLASWSASCSASMERTASPDAASPNRWASLGSISCTKVCNSTASNLR